MKRKRLAHKSRITVYFPKHSRLKPMKRDIKISPETAKKIATAGLGFAAPVTALSPIVAANEPLIGIPLAGLGGATVYMSLRALRAVEKFEKHEKKKK